MMLEPALLNSLVETGQLARAKRQHLDCCILCGICSYVCPSQLPIAENIRRARMRLEVG